MVVVRLDIRSKVHKLHLNSSGNQRTHSATVDLGLNFAGNRVSVPMSSFQSNQRVILLSCDVEALNILQDDRCTMRFPHGLLLICFI